MPSSELSSELTLLTETPSPAPFNESQAPGPPPRPAVLFPSSPPSPSPPSPRRAGIRCESCGCHLNSGGGSDDKTNNPTEKGRFQSQPRRRNSPKTDEQKLAYLFSHFKSWRWNVPRLLHTLKSQRRTHRFRTHWRALEEWCWDNLYTEAGGEPLAKWSRRLLQDGGSHEVNKIYREELDCLSEETTFGKFDAKTDDALLDSLQNLGPLIESRAPQLSSLLKYLGTPADVISSNNGEGSITGKHVLILSVLCMSAHRKSANNIPTILGLYFLEGGLRRRCLQTMSHLGITPSYSGLMERQKLLQEQAKEKVRSLAPSGAAIVSWDNFEYQENRRGERLGDPRKFNSITTAIAAVGRTRPGVDLAKTLLKSNRRSRPFDSGELVRQIDQFGFMDEVSTLTAKPALISA